jgi:hypothetical protein
MRYHEKMITALQGVAQHYSGAEGTLRSFVPRRKIIWADSAYRGKDLADWCKAVGGWDLKVVERTPGTPGFAVQPKR